MTLSLFRNVFSISLFVALGITTQTFAQNTGSSSASQTGSKAQAKILDHYGKLPLSFEANHGQMDARVKFLSRGQGYSLFLTGKEAVIALKKATPRSLQLDRSPGRELAEKQKAGASEGTVVRMELAGGNAVPRVLGAEELPGRANYFIGNDPAKWRTNVPTYAKVKYEDVYPGVDLVYYGNQGALEYDFVVAPGADPNAIGLKFRGSGKLRVDDRGDLLLGSGGEEVRFEKPVMYQEAGGERKPVEGSYVLASANRIGFQLGAYDHRQPLVIDPVLIYSTYLGGTGGDQGNGIAVDASGNAYVTGITNSSDFPTANALQSTPSGGFVTKINASGSALIYSTYLGGAGKGIAVDASGNAYVTGQTSSTNFPTTANALQSTFAGSGIGASNAFVTKINPSGSALVYSTYLGGSNTDSGNRIAVDGSGNAYIVGYTDSPNFPTTPAAIQTTIGGIYDSNHLRDNAFVAKINPTGTALVYSTYLGGSGSDAGYGIAMDASGNAYVTGFTSSTNFPTANALQSTLAGFSNAFVGKVNPTGTALVYSTYLGGAGDDGGYGIAVDASGNAYVTGQTSSTNFPTVNALQSTLAGNSNAFVTKIDPSGSTLVYSTYLGGSDSDGGNGIAVDASGNVHLTGIAFSSDFPTVNAVQPTFGAGMSDAFVTELNASGSALVYSTYLGGSNTADVGLGIAVDGPGNAYVTGYTGSAIFPTTAGAFQTTYGGEGDAFVAKIGVAQGGATSLATTATVSAQTNNAGWNNTNVTVTLNSTDNGGSGVKEITYSATGAQTLSATVNGSSVSILISSEGTTTINFFGTDNAGNVENAKQVVVRLDKTPPSVNCGSSDGLWHGTDVSIPCTASDSVSGLGNSSDGSFSLTTNVPAGAETSNASTGSSFVCNAAENCSTAGPITGNKVDKKSPSISITSPIGGNSYLLNQGVNANFACADGGSGVAACAGTVANASAIDTASVGSKTFTVNATDKVGNVASPQAVSYSVTYAVRLLFDPTRSVHSGSTIPLKIQLCNANNADVSSSSVVVYALSLVQVSTNSSQALQASGNANPDNDFRFDPTLGPAGGYVFNLSTRGLTTGSYLLSFSAGSDPVTHTLSFQVR